MPFQSRGDGRVIGAAEDDGDLAGGEPSGRGEVGGPQRRGEGAHLLPQHCGGPAQAPAGGPDLAGGGLHIQAEADGGGVAFAGGAGAVDELLVGGRRPGVVPGAVGGPPFREAGAGVREGALQHLEGRDPPGPTHRREHPPPGGDPAVLLGRVQENERGMPDLADDGEGALVGVVDHPGPGLGVDVFTQPRHVAG